MTDVTMPQLGETVTEGTITRWAKKVGDTVTADEVLFEVSTDKVDSEVPSPVAGVLSEILVQEGDTVDVGTKLAVVGSAGEGAGAAPAEEKAVAPEPKEEAKPIVTAPAQETPPATPSPTSAPSPAAASASNGGSSDGPGFGGKVLSPVVRKLISDNNLNVDSIKATGAGGRITREDVEAHLAGPSPPSPRTSWCRPLPTAVPHLRSCSTPSSGKG